MRGEREGRKVNFEKKNDKFDMEGGWREVQKILYCKKPPFSMAPM